MENTHKFPETSVCEQVRDFTHDSFGCEAAQSVIRLIEIHTRKKPELLSREELMSLIDWIKSTVSFFTEDEKEDKLEDYIENLHALASGTEQ